MKIEKYVVILTGETGEKTHVKISVNRESNTAEIHLADKVKIDNGEIYIIGEEITKQPLYQNKYDYKLRIYANNTIKLLLVVGGKTYAGSTGKTPKIRDLKKRVFEFENALENKVGEGVDKDMKNPTQKDEDMGVDFGAKTDLKNDEKSTEKLKENHQDNLDKNQREKGVEKIGQQGTEFKGESPLTKQEEMSVENNVEESKNNDVSGLSSQEEKRDESRIFSFDTVRFDGNNFYLSVKPQIDEIFVCYPEEEVLNNLVPNSKWVHINTPDGYYVVGLILDGDVVSYICYGVPSTDKNTPPIELVDLAVWLPLGENDGKGYWVIYQDAQTGKCLK